MIETQTRILDFIGAGLIIFVFLVLVYGIIYIHDIPYEMAKKRNHPHQDAIHVAGIISLFLLHVIWPFLWIWATIYKPGVSDKTNRILEHGLQDAMESKTEIQRLDERIDALSGQLEKEALSEEEA
jgi:hypothetical protein